MKSLKNIILLTFFIIIFVGCKKEKIQNEVLKKSLPVEWLFNEQDQALIQTFSNNMYLKYYDENNNVIEFSADSIHRINTYFEGNNDKGEKISVGYNCLSEYFPNYSFNCWLYAGPNQEIGLSVIFGTGTYWNDRHNDYVLSSFIFNPKEQEDSLNYWGFAVNQEFLDSVNLRDTTFYNVLLNSNINFNTEPKQTIKCWYNKESGIIAFENKDGKLWVRK